MRNGGASFLLTIIGMEQLYVVCGLIGDNFGRRIHGSNGPVAAETPVDALHGTRGNNAFADGNYGQRRMCDVIIDTYREMVLRLLLLHIVENSVYHIRSEIFRSKTIHAGYYLDSLAVDVHGRKTVQVQWVSNTTFFSRFVQHAEPFAGLREGFDEMLFAPRTIEVDFNHSDFSPVGVEVIYDFLAGLSARTHYYDAVFGVRDSVVGYEVVITTGEFTEFLHNAVDELRSDVVVQSGAVVGTFVYPPTGLGRYFLPAIFYWKKISGLYPVPREIGLILVKALSLRFFLASLCGYSFFISSYSSNSTFYILWDVCQPSKKCKKGIPVFNVLTWDMIPIKITQNFTHVVDVLDVR